MQKTCSLVSTTLGVDKHQQRFVLLREGFHLWEEKGGGGGITEELLLVRSIRVQFCQQKQELQDITSLLHHCF